MTHTRHSVPGILATIMGGLLFLWIVLAYAYLLGIADLLNTRNMSDLGAHAQFARLVAFSVLGCFGLFLVGVLLGLIGLAVKGARKTFAIVGLGVNILGVATIVTLNLIIRALQVH